MKNENKNEIVSKMSVTFVNKMDDYIDYENLDTMIIAYEAMKTFTCTKIVLLQDDERAMRRNDILSYVKKMITGNMIGRDMDFSTAIPYNSFNTKEDDYFNSYNKITDDLSSFFSDYARVLIDKYNNIESSVVSVALVNAFTAFSVNCLMSGIFYADSRFHSYAKKGLFREFVYDGFCEMFDDVMKSAIK